MFRNSWGAWKGFRDHEDTLYDSSEEKSDARWPIFNSAPFILMPTMQKPCLNSRWLQYGRRPSLGEHFFSITGASRFYNDGSTLVMEHIPYGLSDELRVAEHVRQLVPLGVVLADFGHALLRRDPLVYGNLYYRAPKTWEVAEFHCQSDLWSLGATVLNLAIQPRFKFEVGKDDQSRVAMRLKRTNRLLSSLLVSQNAFTSSV
ncbi:hypothetical protein SLS62_006255 [Diatrype stigma]|uniref:Protein kinase domain-containing protein n=1 Tax=Diatrype stigma TaxID=117547 RepID=A0AAN9UND9_9PEZI